jgi:phosphoribosylformylglycinamidine synthase I
MKPRALVLTGYGLNTDYELAHGLELAGAQAERVHLNDLIQRRVSLKDFQIAAVPGGFAFADDLGAGKVMAERMRVHLMEDLLEFIDDGKLIFSACNGFQVIVKLGLLPGTLKYGVQEATLTCNDSGRFEDRWVYMKTEQNSNCVFTRGIERLYLPVRHGEGKFVPQDEAVLQQMETNGQIALRYVDEGGSLSGYPWNPNGSAANIAGISDPTGRIFGLMPHPEAYLYRYNHPRWAREKLPEEGQGLKIFKNAVEYVMREL